MKFQIGDRVLVIHSNEEGEVVDIMNEKMVMVDVRGVKFPAYIDQLDFPYFKQFTEKKLSYGKKEKKYIDDVRMEKEKQINKVTDGVWITFLPVMDTDEFGDEIVKELKVHLVNHTAKAYHFAYKLKFFGHPDFELSNQVHAFEDFYLHDVDFEDMSDSPSLEIEFSLIQPDKQMADRHEVSLKLKPKQLFNRIEEIKQKNEATFSYRLFQQYPGKVIPEEIHLGDFVSKGIKAYNASQARQQLDPARDVIDLHIEKIANDWKGLTNYEILDLQLKTFEKYYELAVQHHLPTLVVVHGVGKGKLRDEIHDLLHSKREVKSFVNQYHPSFGYGATEIYFQY
jgi:hypothetical protein